MSAAARLAELGLTLPPVAAPGGAYVPAVRAGQFVYTAGQLPTVDGKLACEATVMCQLVPRTDQEAPGAAAEVVRSE